MIVAIGPPQFDYRNFNAAHPREKKPRETRGFETDPRLGEGEGRDAGQTTTVEDDWLAEFN